MSSVDSIDMINRYIEKILENSYDTEIVVDLMLGMNRSFSVMTPDEKVTVLDYVVGRLVHCRSGK